MVNDKTKIIAHRLGFYETGFPENSLESLKEIFADKTLLDSCSGFEFDINFTKDNIPVIIHDKILDDVSNGHGKIKNYTFEELKKVEFNFRKSGIIKEDCPFKIVSLDELMNFFDSNKDLLQNKIIKVETKNFLSKGKINKLAEVFNSYSKIQENLIHLSFLPNNLTKFKKFQLVKEFNITKNDLLCDHNIFFHLSKNFKNIDQISFRLKTKHDVTLDGISNHKIIFKTYWDKLTMSLSGVLNNNNIKKALTLYDEIGLYVINNECDIDKLFKRVDFDSLGDSVEKFTITSDNPKKLKQILKNRSEIKKNMYVCLHDKLLDKEVFKEEYIKSMNKDKMCVFNSENKMFYDLNGELINIKNSIIFPVSGINQVNEIREVAEKLNIKCFITREDDDKIKSWYNYYNTTRKTKEFDGIDLINEEKINFIEKEFGSEFFFKTKEKDYSALCNVDYLRNNKSILYKSLKKHCDSKFIVSEKVIINEDELGKLEFRCVVINGKIRNISRITEDVVHTIDSNIKSKLESIVEKLKTSEFPTSYVVDLMVYNANDKLITDVVEFNSVCASGMYLYNSIIDLDDSNILHENLYKLPKNKTYMNNQLKNTGTIKMQSSKFFDVPDSFAETVKEYTGELVGVYTHSFNNKNKKRYLDDTCLGDIAEKFNLSDLFVGAEIINSEFELDDNLSANKIK